MKSLKKQAVFPVLMLLVVTALALIGSSFAWFSISNTASVSAFNATAQAAGTGVSLSLDGETYTGSVNLANYVQDGGTGVVIPSSLKTVSTGSSTVNTSTGLLSFYQAEITTQNASSTYITSSADASITSTSGILAANGVASYIAFDLYFKIDSSVTNPVNVYLNYGSKVTNNASQSVVDAIRVAFVDLGTDTSATPTAATVRAFNGGQATGSDSVLIWQPGDADTTYGLTAASATEFLAYTDLSANSQTATVSTYASSALVLAADQEVNETTPETAIATIAAGYSKIRVFIWLEGNDEDCINAIASGAVNVTLNFYVEVA